MSAPDPEIAIFSASLGDVLANGEVSRLREFLRGRLLPVLGGDATPAEILGRAIEEASDPHSYVQRTARLLATLIMEEEVRLRQPEAQLDARSRKILINVL